MTATSDTWIVRGYRSKAFRMSIPWPAVIALAVPAAIVLAVGGYLLVRFPKPYVLTIPFVVAAVIAFAFVADRHLWGRPRGIRFAVICAPAGYVLVAFAWALAGIWAAVGVLILWASATAVIIRLGVLPASSVVWGKPRDPKNTRTTWPF